MKAEKTTGLIAGLVIEEKMAHRSIGFLGWGKLCRSTMYWKAEPHSVGLRLLGFCF
jgi:hypothetical protein